MPLFCKSRIYRNPAFLQASGFTEVPPFRDPWEDLAFPAVSGYNIGKAVPGEEHFPRWNEVIVMALPAEKEHYTYADLLRWDGKERYELIDGEAFMLAGPSSMHQRISFRIARQLGDFLDGKKCEVFLAPYDVRLFEKDGDSPEDVTTVVQPDICVICDSSKPDNRGCKGAPDMVIEILSPSTRRHDRLVKLELYQRSEVREYWIVDPESRSVQVYLRDEGGFLRPCQDYGRTDRARVNVLKGCFIELSRVFPESC